VSVEKLRENEHATFSNFQILYHQKSFQILVCFIIILYNKHYLTVRKLIAILEMKGHLKDTNKLET